MPDLFIVSSTDIVIAFQKLIHDCTNTHDIVSFSHHLQTCIVVFFFLFFTAY